MPNFLNFVLRRETGEHLGPLELGDLLAFGHGLGHGLATLIAEFGLVVESLQMRGAARLVEENDALGFGRMVQGIDDAVGRAALLRQQVLQSNEAHACEAASQECTAVKLAIAGFHRLVPGDGLVHVQ